MRQVADFGLSTVSGGAVVTHLAPESLHGAKPARHADIFAFGVLLWEL